FKTLSSGKSHLVVGHAAVQSRITLESKELSFAVLHLGDHNLTAGVRVYAGSEPYSKLLQEMTHAFSRADLPQLIRLIDHYFRGGSYTLKSLFRDDQRRILDSILRNTLRDVETNLRSIYDHHAPLMRFLHDVNVPSPKALGMAAEFVINSSLRR